MRSGRASSSPRAWSGLKWCLDLIKRIEFLNGVVLGIAIALYAVLVAYGYLSSFETVRRFLNEWQTLVSSVVAVLAVIAAVYAVGLQIRQVDEHKSEDLLRRNLAATAALSQPLSNISKAQEIILKELGKFITSTPKQLQWNTTLSATNAALDDVLALTRCLETASEPATLDISELVSDLQIQAARLNDFRVLPPGTIIPYHAVVGRAVDALITYARIQRLFNYARRRDFRYTAITLPEIVSQSCIILAEQAGVIDELTAQITRFKDPWLCSKFEGRED